MVSTKSFTRLLLCTTALLSRNAARAAAVPTPLHRMAYLKSTPSQAQVERPLTNTVIVSSDLVGVNVVRTNTVSINASKAAAYNANFHEARSVGPPGRNGEIVKPRDSGSQTRTIFFEVVGSCIGIATLIVGFLALRRMPKKNQPDPESPPPRESDQSPSQGTGPSCSASPPTLELDEIALASSTQPE